MYLNSRSVRLYCCPIENRQFESLRFICTITIVVLTIRTSHMLFDKDDSLSDFVADLKVLMIILSNMHK